jgi:hypothetical protein
MTVHLHRNNDLARNAVSEADGWSTWCNAKTVKRREAISFFLLDVSCIECLRAARDYGERAAHRLREIAHAVRTPPTRARKEGNWKP